MKLPSPFPATSENFFRFGRILYLGNTEMSDNAVEHQPSDRWQDWCSRDCLIDVQPSLAMTSTGSLPYQAERMERHAKTQEALFYIDTPVVVVLAPDDGSPFLKTSQILAFSFDIGVGAALHRGIWRDAYRGLIRSCCYYWLAVCSDSPSIWIEISGSPIRLERAA